MHNQTWLRRGLLYSAGDDMSHVVPPLLYGKISTWGYLHQIQSQTIGINAKQQDLATSGLCWDDRESFEEFHKPSFAKGRPREPSGLPFFLRQILTCWYLLEIDYQTLGINTKRQDLGASGHCWQDLGSFEELQIPCFAKGGDHMAGMVPPLLWCRISTCGYLLQIECQTIGINSKQQDLAASGLGLHDQGSSKELQKCPFAKRAPHEPCGALFKWLNLVLKYSLKAIISYLTLSLKVGAFEINGVKDWLCPFLKLVTKMTPIITEEFVWQALLVNSFV